MASPQAEHGLWTMSVFDVMDEAMQATHEEDRLEVAEEVEVRGPPLLGEVDPDEFELAEASEVALLRRVLSGG